MTRLEMESRRCAAISLIREDRATAEIAKLFHVSRASVYRWKARLEKQHNLDATIASGRPCKLTTPQLQELKIEFLRILQSQGQRPHAAWAADFIAYRFGVHYSEVDAVRRLLVDLGVWNVKSRRAVWCGEGRTVLDSMPPQVLSLGEQQ